MFRALLAHPQEALNLLYLVYCVRIISVGCYQDWRKLINQTKTNEIGETFSACWGVEMFVHGFDGKN
jgi:hypothetical protein